MKKSLSRVLSLALALVMLLGAMPFALADDPVTPTYDVTVTPSATTANVGDKITFTATISPDVPEGTTVSYDWSLTGTEEGNKLIYTVAATDADKSIPVAVNVKIGEEDALGTTSIAVYAIAEGVTITGDKEVKVGEPLQLTGTVTPVGADPTLFWKSSDETIATVDEKTGLVTGIKEGKVTITANSPAFPDAKGTYEVNVKSAASAYTVEISNVNDLYLNEKDKDTNQLTATLKPAEGVTMPKYIEYVWKSNNDKVSVDETGKVIALKAGDAEVSVIAFIKGEDEKLVEAARATATFKVVENAIDCNNEQYPYSSSASVTLKPSIKDVTNVKWDFEIESGKGTITKGTDTVKVSPSAAGVMKIKITASWDGHSVSKTVSVSFYEEVNATATVKTGVTNFLFSDTSVFSSVAVDGKSVSGPQNYAMLTLWGGVETWSKIVLEQQDPNSTVATITYPSQLDAFKPNAKNEYGFYNSQKLKFTCLKKGVFKFDYYLVTSDNLTVQYGTITINTQEGAANVKYKTSYTNSVTINEKDFAQYWKDSKMSSDLDYVKFGVSNVIPYYGKLYTTNSTSTRKEVTANMSFDYNATSKDTYDLDLVTFVPSASKKTSYTEEIPFTCYGTKSGDTLSGVMVIEVTGDLPFKDVKTTDWFYEDVAYVYNNDIMNGTAADKFEPNSTLTRAMVVTMLYRIEGEPSVSYSGTFKDVTKNQWYTEAVEWAAKNNIVNGFDANTFGPSRAITREQLAAILYRYASYKKLDTSHGSSLSKFYDSDKVSSYAKDALEWAVYEGIMNGEAGNLKPTGTATRAQAAAMFHRFLED